MCGRFSLTEDAAKGATLGEGKGSLFGPEGTALVIHADADDE
jgi:Cu/Zn superoxide dismutase